MVAPTTSLDERFYLGTLCKRGHDHEGTGQSLRRVRGRACVECVRLQHGVKTRKRAQRPAPTTGEEKRERERERNTTPAAFARRARYSKTGKAKEAKARYAAKPTTKARKLERQRERYATDEQFVIARRLRYRLWAAMRAYGSGKDLPASDLGIDYAAIIEHLGPCPGPRRKWHVDHVRPLCSFDLTDPAQVREAFAPENHQWLHAGENIRKGGKVQA